MQIGRTTMHAPHAHSGVGHVASKAAPSPTTEPTQEGVPGPASSQPEQATSPSPTYPPRAQDRVFVETPPRGTILNERA
jgi:hypothetical protein